MNETLAEELKDVVPISVRNAALSLREAVKDMEAAERRQNEAAIALHKAEALYEQSRRLHRRAIHRLKISAMQPNGGEE